MLSEFKIDRIAQAELLLLSQQSEFGHMEANNIISKLIKKQSEWHTLKNPSGFVHSAVQGVRHDMLPMAHGMVKKLKTHWSPCLFWKMVKFDDSFKD